ncbi:hypothetical protein JVT61DRAFT_10545 [Boletus reticuloceps]|uniref:Uncharacterized protein n=1 Tax=Boletus reticuloceps TaxID=495285 RepID=A0A8I3AC71_9AGAM|nr:hypothetical protein JVT61DRAFT_10545 [Boletus reticuloceps]
MPTLRDLSPDPILHYVHRPRSPTNVVYHPARLELPELVETIALLADVMDLRTEQACTPAGYVLESRILKGFGPVSTVLMTRGTFSSKNQRAQAIAEMHNAQSTHLHITHPLPVSTLVLLRTISDHLHLPLVPLAEWTARLETHMHMAPLPASSLKLEDPALMLLRHLRTHAHLWVRPRQDHIRQGVARLANVARQCESTGKRGRGTMAAALAGIGHMIKKLRTGQRGVPSVGVLRL